MVTHEDICKAVNQVASAFPVKRASYFGSYAEGRQTEASDLDLLIEFHQSAVSLLMLASIKYELEDILKIPIDIIHAPICKDAVIEIVKTVSVYEQLRYKSCLKSHIQQSKEHPPCPPASSGVPTTLGT
ncbi:MAG: nucleotidyltransferase domain-containing protein [Desulfovibrio sp.]|nr:nucleotidyltransferase domain-containing protein [Desulfovibrio sp.]